MIVNDLETLILKLRSHQYLSKHKYSENFILNDGVIVAEEVVNAAYMKGLIQIVPYNNTNITFYMLTFDGAYLPLPCFV